MPRYHLSLSPVDRGGYAATLMDTRFGWPIEFGRCSKQWIDGKAAIYGDSTGAIPDWSLTVRTTEDPVMFSATATDGRHFRIAFPECELEHEGGRGMLNGWAEEADIITEEFAS